MVSQNTIERDYRLNGPENLRAHENGLVEAVWYTPVVPRETMRDLLKRRNGPAIRDTLIWFGLLAGSGYSMAWLWGSWWMIIPLAIYATIYGSTSDSRWHEAGHGTAFRTPWMNNVLYEIASFMVVREATPWRWSHNRHHSDTIIRGRDPEIAVQRPPNIRALILDFINLVSAPREFRKMILHAAGRLDSQEVAYLPATEYGKTFSKARIYLAIYAATIGLSVYYRTLLPLMLIGLPSFIGAWLKIIYGLTQHAGMAENVLDHRLNSRTIRMNRIHRYLYWNMNFHIEHHIFPMVPYHALPKLHELVRDRMPAPKKGIIDAYREIIPAVLRQVRDPDYFVKRELPGGAEPALSPVKYENDLENRDAEGLLKICSAGIIARDDVIRFDAGSKTFAVYRASDDKLYATDGICTHGNTHLSGGLMLGDQVECPKHNGRFSFKDGSPKRPPACRAINTYDVVEKNGILYLKLADEVLSKLEQQTVKTTFKVISNKNVATFIKELVLEPIGDSGYTYAPGDYLQLEIPPYSLDFETLSINDRFATVWREMGLYQYKARNSLEAYRNYSMASNPELENHLRFNVRISLPPEGMTCSAGSGSSYVFSLKSGDIVKATGPFGDFHIKESDKEMIYIGGGSGMAPLRAHISYLFDSLGTGRKVSYWYGARSKRDLFYVDYFEDLARKYENFSFHVSLSEPLPEDRWDSHTGLIHDVLKHEYLGGVADPAGKEYYLCGPPELIKATTRMLAGLGVPPGQIAYDEFS